MTFKKPPKLTLVPEISDPDLQCTLGEMYFFGKGIAQNMHLGVQWYTKAAVQGHIGAQCSLGFCYQRGAGVMRDIAQALHWYVQAADQKDAFAAYYLGLIYEKGDGVSPDLLKACEWFGKAANWGHREASFRKSELESRSPKVIQFSDINKAGKIQRTPNRGR